MRKNNGNLTELHALFAIKHGNKFDLNKMEKCPASEEAVAFVGRAGTGNGIVAFVQKLLASPPFEHGLITVALGGAALSSFVQPRPFYTAQNIDVLEPLTPMSLDAKLYYCLCIEANRFRYSTFGREANRTLKDVARAKIGDAARVGGRHNQESHRGVEQRPKHSGGSVATSVPTSSADPNSALCISDKRAGAQNHPARYSRAVATHARSGNGNPSTARCQLPSPLRASRLPVSFSCQSPRKKLRFLPKI